MSDFTNSLLTDLYQLTMVQGFFNINKHREICVFDRFYRNNPFGGAYSVVAGVEHVIKYLQNLRFSNDDILYLKETKIFSDKFLNHLKNFKFTGDVYAVLEGSVVFPKEILLRIHAPREEAMIIETAVSMILNHESLIATKARRIRSVAGDDMLLEFGLRRAQGKSAGVYGARAAIIGGFNATSNVLAAAKFNIKPIGTMAHSWVMSFDNEYEAFKAYAKQYEDMLILLVDTYDTLNQGVLNAIKIFKEIRNKRGGNMPKGYGIRLDSGDLAYLSKEARKMLDEEGFEDAVISASNDLDEYIIADLKRQGAAINSWGVGTKLITADQNPSFGGVYKLAGQWDERGIFKAKMKFSDNIEKITIPGIKNTLRLTDLNTLKLVGDVISLDDEVINEKKDYVFYSPQYPWKRTFLSAGTFSVTKLLHPVMKNGKLLKPLMSLQETAEFAQSQVELLWPEYLRLVNPPENRVNLSQKLYDMQSNMILQKAKVSK